MTSWTSDARLITESASRTWRALRLLLGTLKAVVRPGGAWPRCLFAGWAVMSNWARYIKAPLETVPASSTVLACIGIAGARK